MTIQEEAEKLYPHAKEGTLAQIAFYNHEQDMRREGYIEGRKKDAEGKGKQWLEITQVEWNGNQFKPMDWQNWRCYSTPHFEAPGHQLSIGHVFKLPCKIYLKFSESDIEIPIRINQQEQ